jgi:hypothetical protein
VRLALPAGCKLKLPEDGVVAEGWVALPRRGPGLSAAGEYHLPPHCLAQVMLNSPMLKASSSERTLLKNLGAFLGRLTIAKNRPVLQVRCAAAACRASHFLSQQLLALRDGRSASGQWPS